MTFYSDNDFERGHKPLHCDTLAQYVCLCNHHIPQKALGHIFPVQAFKEWQHKNPKRFKKRVYNLSGLDRLSSVKTW